MRCVSVVGGEAKSPGWSHLQLLRATAAMTASGCCRQTRSRIEPAILPRFGQSSSFSPPPSLISGDCIRWGNTVLLAMTKKLMFRYMRTRKSFPLDRDHTRFFARGTPKCSDLKLRRLIQASSYYFEYTTYQLINNYLLAAVNSSLVNQAPIRNSNSYPWKLRIIPCR